MARDELTREDVLNIFFTTQGGIDRINAAIDARLADGRKRSITLFEKFLRARLDVSPKKLKMPNMDITPIEAAYLSQYPDIRNVETLDLRQNKLGDEGLEVLAGSPYLTELKEWDLRNNRITRVGVNALAESENFEKLKSIDLRLNQLGRQWEKKLKENKKFSALEEVRVG